MGLSTPATKIWEIPEPKPFVIPKPTREQPEREPEAVPVRLPKKERVPA